MKLQIDKNNLIYGTAGFTAGILNGFFGAGGGLILVPMLIYAAKLSTEKALPTSLAIILPICIVSCLQRYTIHSFDIISLWPYLAGGLAGGIIGGLTYKKVSKIWLRRILGGFVLYAGVKMIFKI